MSAMSAVQRLALAKVIGERLEAVRKKDLVPQAQAELDEGERHAARFGGKRVAWVSMPKASDKSAYVSDDAQFLAWARENYPELVEDHVSIRDPADSDVIDHLADHFPQALSHEDRVQPQFVAGLLTALKGGGYFVTGTGEKLTEVPGITVSEADPAVPRVTLEADAADTIAAAWRAAEIPFADLLALPAGGDAE